jgi:hypothetical protein
MRRLARPPASLKWVYLVTLLAAIGVVTSYLVPGVGDRKQADATLANPRRAMPQSTQSRALTCTSGVCWPRIPAGATR